MDPLNPIAQLPMGFGMALAQDYAALERFTALSLDAQRAIIDQTHGIQSKNEMRDFVQNI